MQTPSQAQSGASEIVRKRNIYLYVIAQVHDCFSYPMREQAPALYNFARHCEELKATWQSKKILKRIFYEYL